MPDLPFDLRQSERERERGGGIGRRSRRGREEWERRWKGRISIISKVNYTTPEFFSRIFSISLSLSLFNEVERTRREFFSVPRHAFEFHRKGGGGGYKNISLRLEKSYRRILCALYLINRTNSSFHSLPFFEMTQFWTQPGSKNRTGRCFDTEFCSVIFLGRLVS